MTVKDPQHDLNAPRKWFDLFMKMNGFWAFVAAIFLIVMTVFSLKDYQNAARLADHSEVATATIVDKYSRRSDYKTKYYLSYRLEVERSQYNFKRSTSRGNYDAKDVGDTIEVFYWPEDPKVLELVKGETLRSAKSGQFFALVAGMIALSVVWFLGSRTNRAILARKKGVQTTARITRIEERKRKGRATGKGYLEFGTADQRVG